MRKIIIALGLIFILAASSIPSWGKDNVIYVCYLEKEQQARTVGTLSNCEKSEMAIALNQAEPNAAADQDISKRAQEVARKYPTWPASSMFKGGSGSFRTSP
jgi:hypothetical protein